MKLKSSQTPKSLSTTVGVNDNHHIKGKILRETPESLGTKLSPSISPTLIDPNHSHDKGQTDKGSDGPIDKRSMAKLRKQLHKMSNEELSMLLSAEDDFVLDCLVNQTPGIKKLQQELDELKKQVSILAKFNYAREPEFVRDRTKLREVLDDVAGMVRYTTSRHLEPILDKLNQLLNKLTSEATRHEELSESMAQDFLNGKKSYTEFIDQYIKLRKETSKKRIVADKLAKERTTLANTITPSSGNAPNYSPVPTPRQRKRVSFNK